MHVMTSFRPHWTVRFLILYFKTITDLGFPSADLHNGLREDTATSCYTHEAFIAIVIFSFQIDASVNGTLR